MENWDALLQSKRLHAPLRDGDTAQASRGCRHTNPDSCRNNEMAGVCAFVRPDGMCWAPPRSWPRQYQKLTEASE